MMFAGIFNTLLVKPILNLLISIYAIVPGNNFGVAIIIFTIIARFLMWPIVKKQLHHAKAMRELQPEIKKIKKEAGGDRQKVAVATMALYKQREINPLSSIGYLLLQLPIFIALYQGVNRIASDPQAIIDNSYSFVADLSHMKELDQDISKFDPTFVGTTDLTRKPLEDGGIYWGAMVFVFLSAFVQYYSSKQLMATGTEKKSLRKLLKDQGAGKDVDQSEITEAASRFTLYIIPVVLFVVSLSFVAALPFYWFVNGLIGLIQQNKVLGQDKAEILATVDGIEEKATVVTKKLNAKQKREAMKKTSSSSRQKNKKRR